MSTAIDGGGRVVIPKRTRDSLGLVAGTKLEVEEVDGDVMVRPEEGGVRVEIADDGLPILVYDHPTEPLTTEQIREILECVRP